MKIILVESIKSKDQKRKGLNTKKPKRHVDTIYNPQSKYNNKGDKERKRSQKMYLKK